MMVITTAMTPSLNASRRLRLMRHILARGLFERALCGGDAVVAVKRCRDPGLDAVPLIPLVHEAWDPIGRPLDPSAVSQHLLGEGALVLAFPGGQVAAAPLGAD